MRTRYSFYNFLVSLITSVALPIFGFIKVRMFIDLYGSDLNGLQLTIMNVITFLNVFELSYSLAFRQLLFKPLAEDDRGKVLSIYNGAVKVFRFTGMAVLIVGALTALLFPMFAQSPLGYGETVTMFLILCVPFGLSYFLMGPNFVIIADQKEYKINIWIQTIAILRMVLMVGVILLKLPYVYIFLIEGLQVFIANFIARRIALKNYPWLKENKQLAYDDAFQKNAKYTIIQRLSTLATNNTDNLVITFFMGYTMTSVYGSYSYLTESVSKIINSAITSPINSFGNLFNDSGADSYSVFTEFFNFAVYIASIIGVCIFVVIGRFVLIWMKMRPEYSVTLLIAFLFAINIFYMTMREPIIICRDANGLFKDAKNNAYLLAISKVVLSIVLIQPLGIAGVLAATMLTNWTVDFLYNPVLVYKKVFRLNPLRYYKMVFSRLAVAILIGAAAYAGWQTQQAFVTSSTLHFLIGCVVLGMLVFVVFTIVYWFSYASFRKLIQRGWRLIRHKMNQNKEVQA